MCWADRCCYCVKLDMGCLFIGICSFIFSIVLITFSAACLGMDLEHDKMPVNKTAITHDRLQSFLEANISKPSINIVLWFMLSLGLLLLLATFLLAIGLIKNKPGFLLFYFTFGIFFTISGLLSALLIILNKCWTAAVFLTILSIIYIHFLVVVHTVYEGMQRGKKFGFASHNRLEEEDSLNVSEDITPKDL